MTFDQIVAEAADKLNLTSPSAITRLGKNVNERYRRLTSSIGLEVSRRGQVSCAATIGDRTMTFVGIEKIITVVDKSTTPQDTVLEEITPDELHITPVRTEPPRHFAILNMHANSVTVELDCIPATAFLLYADGHINLLTLSGVMSPNFSESFHDILVFGAMADEYRKMEKLPLMQDAEANYTQRVSDLRMWIAKTAFKDITQGRYNGKSFRWSRDAQLVWDS